MDQLIFQVVEHGLGHLPFTEKQVITPTGRSAQAHVVSDAWSTYSHHKRGLFCHLSTNPFPKPAQYIYINITLII